MSNDGNKLTVIVGLVGVLVIAGFVAYKLQITETELDADISELVEPAPVEEEVLPEVPVADIPTPEPDPLPVENEMEEVEPLPAIDDSDSFLREKAGVLSKKSELKTWLDAEDLMRRFAAYSDGVSRGVLLPKVFPLSPPSDSFTTHSNGEQIWLNAGNYERYDTTVSVITEA